MPEILPKEITNKYTIEKGGFIMKVKNDTNDKIELEVGDKTENKFYPQIKIKRWDDEVNFLMKLTNTDIDNPELTYEGDRIVWTKKNIACRLWDIPANPEYLEKAYEFEIVLPKKPTTNKIEFAIQTKGLDFFYQPALTQAEIDEGQFRPENVVGSYAVYCSENKINLTGGKLYRTGKFGHIYRPKIIDSIGKSIWGVLNIDVPLGLLTITIDQSFLDIAVYPVFIDPTFGYTTAGASGAGYGANWINSSSLTYTGAVGTGVSMSIYGAKGAANSNLQMALYNTASPSNLIANGSTPSVLVNSTAQWWTSNFSTGPTLSAVQYYLAYNQDNAPTIYYDSGANRYYVSQAFGTWPSTISWGDAGAGIKFSIYCTYTAGGINNYIVTITDSEILSDISTRTIRFNRALLDTMTLVGSISFGYFKTIVEVLSLNEVFTKTQRYLKSLTDALSLNGIVSRITRFNKTFADTFSLSDIFSSIRGFLISVSDNLSLTGVVSRIVRFGKVFTDAISLSDIVSAGKIFWVTIVETIYISVTEITYTITVLENIILNGITSLVVRFNKAISDTISLIDSILFGAQRFTVTVINTLSLNEIFSKTFGVVKSFTDIISLNDIFSRLYRFRQTITETINLNGIIVKIVRFNRILTETLNLNEIFSKIQGIIKSFTDIVSLSGILSTIKGTSKSFTDAISLSGVLTRKYDFKQTITDILTLIDTVSFGVNQFVITIVETLNLNEVFSRISNFFKSVSDILSLNEIFSKSQGVVKSLIDTLSLTGILSLKLNYKRIESDIITLVDSISFGLQEFVITIVETLKLNEVLSLIARFWDWLAKHTSTWVYQAKSAIPTWTHQTKSAIPTWSHQTKNTSSWSFENKSSSPSWTWKNKSK